jgi:NTE family protein
MPSGHPAAYATIRRPAVVGSLAFAILTTLFVACAHAPRNVPLAAHDPAAGYRFQTSATQSDGSGLMVALFFSGGGTRAAAFSYGVLHELAATPVPGAHRMLDEVTTINAVSGGSFTAAYYCLRGDKIFADFEHDFLKRNVQETLFWRCLSPRNGVRLLSSNFGRSDLAAEYYDEILFHGATYGDLATTGAARPFLVINATNLSTYTPVQFTQDQFDLIGSDLNRYPISRAVAASSAVPLLFTPITLKNYADQVPPGDSFRLPRTNNADLFSGYRAALAETSRAYSDAGKYPYMHLMDGGLTDNLSLRNLLDAVTLSGGWESVLERVRKRGINKLVIILVNAAVDTKQDWVRRENIPGVISVVSALSNSSVLRTNKETEALVEGSLSLWQSQRPARWTGSSDMPKVYFIRVDFHSTPDAAERAYFDAIPTSLHLPAETVDHLIQAAGRLLREAPAYRELLKDLEASQPARADLQPPAQSR